MALAEHLNAQKIILYNAYQQPMPADPMLTEPTMNAMEVYNISELGDISREHLNKFKDEIQHDAPASLQIEVIGEFNDLTEGIEEVCAAQAIDLVVTGITIGDKLTETLVGSHAVDIAKQVTTPVLIVPHEADYKPIQSILFACDYKQVATTTPVEPIEKIVSETGAQLHVLHINETAKEANLTTETATLKRILQNVLPQYHTVQSNDFSKAINAFIEQYNIDLVVAIPKKHGFFEGLFRKSHIKTLAFHTHVPLILMHEE
jgi:nucleotide-binding universal stress UspA family protein